MNGTENTCAGNRKNRPKWPMLWAILALYRRCFFTLHHASTLHHTTNITVNYNNTVYAYNELPWVLMSTTMDFYCWQQNHGA